MLIASSGSITNEAIAITLTLVVPEESANSVLSPVKLWNGYKNVKRHPNIISAIDAQ